MKFSTLATAFIVFGLFIISLITGAGIIALNNEPSQNFANYTGLDSLQQDVATNLGDSYLNANVSETTATQSDISTGGGGIVLDSFAGVWTLLKASPVAIYNVFASFVQEQGIIPNIVLITIATLLMMFFLLAAWKLLQQGEG